MDIKEKITTRRKWGGPGGAVGASIKCASKGVRGYNVTANCHPQVIGVVDIEERIITCASGGPGGAVAASVERAATTQDPANCHP